jgi:hypothetical protein
MNLSQGTLADGLTKEILKTIHKYDDAIYFATVLGVLEIVKAQLFQDKTEDDDDHEND